MYISKKRVRLAIMDALDDVLKNGAHTVFSKDTRMAIIEAVEKITESVERDFDEQGKTVGATAERGRAIAKSRKLSGSSSAKKKMNHG